MPEEIQQAVEAHLTSDSKARLNPGHWIPVHWPELYRTSKWRAVELTEYSL